MLLGHVAVSELLDVVGLVLVHALLPIRAQRPAGKGGDEVVTGGGEGGTEVESRIKCPAALHKNQRGFPHPHHQNFSSMK